MVFAGENAVFNNIHGDIGINIAESVQLKRQIHIYQAPFYYIDYSLAQICTFFLYSEMQEDREAAWNRYLNLCKAGGTKSYFDLLQDAGLPVPFEDGAVETAVRGVIEEIEKAPY